MKSRVRSFKKYILPSDVVRIGSIVILHLVSYFILCDVTFLVRLQGKFEMGHSWEWKGQGKTSLSLYSWIWGGFSTKTPALRFAELGRRPWFVCWLRNRAEKESASSWISLVGLWTTRPRKRPRKKKGRMDTYRQDTSVESLPSVCDELWQLSVRHELIQKRLDTDQLGYNVAVLPLDAHHEGQRPQHIGADELGRDGKDWGETRRTEKQLRGLGRWKELDVSLKAKQWTNYISGAFLLTWWVQSPTHAHSCTTWLIHALVTKPFTHFTHTLTDSFVHSIERLTMSCHPHDSRILHQKRYKTRNN